MKGVLEFNLPEDQEDFKLAQQGGKLQSAVLEMDHFLRQYKHVSLDDNERAILSQVKTKFFDLFGEYI